MNILIVGKNSYIARRCAAWFAAKSPQPRVDLISVRDEGWRSRDLSVYDAVLYTAAIVHRKDDVPESVYDEVNARQPRAFAEAARAAGVRQFIFLSTMGVYGKEKQLPDGCVIDADTPLLPASFYGSSKLKGETLLRELESPDFHVSIIRPANVYGRDCKGNYIPGFAKITRLLPLLPRAFDGARQGMLFVDNLAELCWLAAGSDRSGVYPAQDRRPVSSYEIMRAMAACICPRKPSLRVGALLRPFARHPLVVKLFGGVSYADDYAACPLGNYALKDFDEAIREVFE